MAESEYVWMRIPLSEHTEFREGHFVKIAPNTKQHNYLYVFHGDPSVVPNFAEIVEIAPNSAQKRPIATK